MSAFEEEKKYVAKRVEEIMRDARFVQNMEINILFDGFDTVPQIEYTIKEAIVPMNVCEDLETYEKEDKRCLNL